MNQWSAFTGAAQVSTPPGQGAASGLGWNGAEQNPAFAAQVQQALGEDCQPDAEFFVLCWTVGAAKATDDLLERRRIQNQPVYRAASSTSFFPSISSEEFVRSRQMYAPPAPLPTAAAGLFRNLPENGRPAAYWESEFDNDGPFTVERARHLLGVSATSTPAQIKDAYRHLVRMYHPDRHETGSSQDRLTATHRMVAINQAYSLLSTDRPSQSAVSATPWC